MGNIIIPRSYTDQWLRESREAKKLLALTPYNQQEQLLIEAAKREGAFKNLLGFLLGVSFCASLKRYFPETIVTQNNFIYGMACASVMVPVMTVVGISCNKDVVERLKILKTNHDILAGR